MAVIYTPHFAQFFDSNGDPLAGGKLYTYAAGTTTLKATYSTSSGATANTNPVILDSAGRAVLFIDGSYRFNLHDANDVLIQSTDNITAFTTTGVSADSFFQAFSGDGSTTAFTLSEDLGADEKTIMVFVDAGGGVGFEIQAPSAYTLNGTTLTFVTHPATGTNNIYVWAPALLAGAASAAAFSAEASATSAAVSAAYVVAASASVTDVSTSSNSIGTGEKTFTVSAGKSFVGGMYLLIIDQASSANYMSGFVSSYSGTTLIMNVMEVGGSGTKTAWNIIPQMIIVSGVRTYSGAQRGTVNSLTSSSSHISIDMSLGNYFSHALTESTTLDNPTNAVGGQGGQIVINQHASSAKTLAFGSYWKSLDGSTPTVSTTVSAQNLLSWYAADATHIWYSLNKNGVA